MLTYYFAFHCYCTDYKSARAGDILEVSLDYLLGKTKSEVDKNTLKLLQDIAELPEEDKNNIFYTLNNLIKAAKLKTL